MCCGIAIVCFGCNRGNDDDGAVSGTRWFNPTLVCPVSPIQHWMLNLLPVTSHCRSTSLSEISQRRWHGQAATGMATVSHMAVKSAGWLTPPSLTRATKRQQVYGCVCCVCRSNAQYNTTKSQIHAGFLVRASHTRSPKSRGRRSRSS